MGLATVVTRDESLLQLFYNTSNKNLAMLFRNGSTSGSDPKELFEAAGETDMDGSVFNPSDLVGLRWNNVDWVFGITLPKKPKDGDYVSYSVSVVSPVYLPLVATQYGDKGLENNRITAVTNGASAWIYYLTLIGGNISINEWSFHSSTGTTLSAVKNIGPNSALTSFYNTTTGRRHIIYQANDDHSLIDAIPNGSTNPISPTSDAVKGTSLAATFNKGVAWLYYTDDVGHIHRINTGEDGEWTGATMLKEAARAGKLSQLSVVTANGINHLFYYQDEDKTPTHWRDFTPNSIKAP